MEKTARAELIAALVTDKHSGFADGDEAILEAASDERLERFRSAADASRSASNDRGRLETDFRNTSARLKVAEERIKAAEQPMSEEEFLQKAPEAFKAVLVEHKTLEDGMRASLVSQLKDLGANTEAELKTKSIDELKTLAAYARVPVPDFSGRGLPKERDMRAAQTYAAPDPYAAALDQIRGSKTVN